jgi:hypothetical protein
MSDKDASVREAAGETIGVLAKNYVSAKGQALPHPNPILQVALDTIVCQSRDLSAAGGIALSAMSSYVGCLDQETLKHLFKLIATDNFSSKHYVLQACATWDIEKERGGGFVMRGMDTLLPAVGALIGVPKSPSRSGALMAWGTSCLFILRAAAQLVECQGHMHATFSSQPLWPQRTRLRQFQSFSSHFHVFGLFSRCGTHHTDTCGPTASHCSVAPLVLVWMSQAGGRCTQAPAC